MRRRAGIGAIHLQKAQQDKFKEKKEEIKENEIGEMTKQMEMFKTKLEEFASKYSSTIKKDPQFRKQFQDMCASIGVDPLASSKGFWSEMLGVGDFYYELGVQMMELCLATAHRNGGILATTDAARKLNQGRRRPENQVSEDDIMRAIKKMKVLGPGLEVLSSGTSHFICSVPGEFSMDHTLLLREGEKRSGHLTITFIQSKLNWTLERTQRTLDHLLQVGLIWIDKQDRPPSYWFPAFFCTECD